jgi:hypothetical protein
MSLAGNSQLKGALGRPNNRWVDNIKIGVGEIGWGRVDWIELD